MINYNFTLPANFKTSDFIEYNIRDLENVKGGDFLMDFCHLTRTCLTTI